MAVYGLCGGCNNKKYYCKNYFLTFKCYCCDYSERDVARLFIWGDDKYWKSLFWFCFFGRQYFRTILQGQTHRSILDIHVSIIECLTKICGAWGHSNIYGLSLCFPLTRPPSNHCPLFVLVPPQLSASFSFCRRFFWGVFIIIYNGFNNLTQLFIV